MSTAIKLFQPFILILLSVIGLLLPCVYLLDFENASEPLFDHGDCNVQACTSSSSSSSQTILVSSQERTGYSIKETAPPYSPATQPSSFQRSQFAWSHSSRDDGQNTLAMPRLQAVEETLRNSLPDLSATMAASYGQNICPPAKSEADAICSVLAFAATGLEQSASNSRLATSKVKEPDA